MILLDKVLFGPAGYPEAAKGNPERVFEILKELGLDALEYAAVHGLRTSVDRAQKIGELADKNGISMSMHAAYYVQLASKSEDIRERSKERLKKALRFAPLMRVKRIVFHPGTHGGMPPDESYKVIRDAIQEVWEEAGPKGEGAVLAPEIAGKIGAFGSADEIIRLCSDLEGVIPTIDWAHLYARSQGRINNRESYSHILEMFENALEELFVDNMHFHVSGIIFTEAGERSHKPLGESWGPDILPLIELVNELGYKPTFISETPNPVTGALYAKFLLEELEKTQQ